MQERSVSANTGTSVLVAEVPLGASAPVASVVIAAAEAALLALCLMRLRSSGGILRLAAAGGVLGLAPFFGPLPAGG